MLQHSNNQGPDSRSSDIQNRLAELERQESWLTRYQLQSGNVCGLKVPATSWNGQRLLLYFPDVQGAPTDQEKNEMLAIARAVAEKKAQDHLGNSQAFTLLLNGKANTRVKDFHINIYITNDLSSVLQQLIERNPPKNT